MIKLLIISFLSSKQKCDSYNLLGIKSRHDNNAHNDHVKENPFKLICIQKPNLL